MRPAIAVAAPWAALSPRPPLRVLRPRLLAAAASSPGRIPDSRACWPNARPSATLCDSSRAEPKPGPPPEPASAPASTAIPGVIAAGQTWKVVWQWEGNNADGLIAGDNGTVLFANNDASNVMRLDPATGLATIIHKDTNTGGAVSRSKNGAVSRGARIERGHPATRAAAQDVCESSFRGEPIECVGVLNDLVADSRGGVYLSITGGGLFYANPQGVVSQYGDGVAGANGIILSRDEKTLYVTNGAVVIVFDVQADGSLTNQRSSESCAAVRPATVLPSMRKAACMWRPGRPWTSSRQTARSSAAFAGRRGCTARRSAVATRRRSSDRLLRRWGTASARNQVIAIPTIAQGYTGRAK